MAGDYIQIFQRHKKGDKKHLKVFEDGDLVLWFPKDPKIKEGKFLFPWTNPFQIKKTFGNNNIQLNMLSIEDVASINVNKLKAYRKPIKLIVIATAIIVMTKNMENSPPRQLTEDPIFGDKWKQLAKLYEGLNFHQKNKMTPHNYQKKTHPKKYNKLLITILKNGLGFKMKEKTLHFHSL
jgi:hypothetical protein